MSNGLNRIGRQSEQLMNDELYKLYHLMKHLDDVPIGQTPPEAKYDKALWVNSKDNMLYSYCAEKYTWQPMFKEKFQLLDQLLNKGEPISPRYGQLWLNNEILMYFDGEDFRPVKTVTADDHEIDMSFFNNFLLIPELKTIGETKEDNKQYLIPSVSWDRLFLDGEHDDTYETIHHSCIQYPKTMDKNASLVHVNPSKLKRISKRFFKLDTLSGGLDINTKNKEFYAFEVPEEICSTQPIGGVLLKKDEDYKIITNEFEFDKDDSLQSTINFSKHVLKKYSYLLVVEYAFDEFNTRGSVKKFQHLDDDIYRGYQIVPLLYPFNVFLDHENLNETSFKYNNLDGVVFVDDIDKPFYKDAEGNTILFGEIYEGQRIVELDENVLKLYGQNLEDREHDLTNLPPLDDFGNLKPKELIETYGKQQESNQAMIKDIIKNAEMAVMSAEHKDVGVIQHLVEQDGYISGLITLRNHHADPIIFLNGQALYEPLGDFTRMGSTVKIPRTHLGATYAVIDGAEDTKTQVLAYGSIGDEYTYADAVKDSIFKDKEKLVLIGELFEESGKLDFKNGNLYITGVAEELDKVLPEIPRVEINSVEVAIDKDGNLIAEDIIEHPVHKPYKDDEGKLRYDPTQNDEYYLKIPRESIGVDQKIIVFIDGLLVSKKDIYKDSEGNIYIENIRYGQTYMILKYSDNILFDFEMKPAISFSSSFSENLVYMNDKIICNSESIRRDRLDIDNAVHNEIQQCKKSYEENGVSYEANTIYICDKYHKRWNKLGDDEQHIVENIACQYDNAISSITTYIEDFKTATVYLYDYADERSSSLSIGGIELEGYKNTYMVQPAKDVKDLPPENIPNNTLTYDVKNDQLYIRDGDKIENVSDNKKYFENKNDITLLMGDTLYSRQNNQLRPLTDLTDTKAIMSLKHSLYSPAEGDDMILANLTMGGANLPSILSARYGNQSYAFVQTEPNENSFLNMYGNAMNSSKEPNTKEEYLTVKMPPDKYYKPHTNSLSVYLAGIRQSHIIEADNGQEFTIPGMYKGDVTYIVDNMQAKRKHSCVRIKSHELDPIAGMANALEINNKKDLYPGHASVYIDGIRQNRNAFKVIDKKVIQFYGDGISYSEDGSLKSDILIEVTDNYSIREVAIPVDRKRHLSNNNLCLLSIGSGKDLPSDIMRSKDPVVIYINGVLYTSHLLDNGATIDRTNMNLVMTDAPIVQRVTDGDIITVKWR